ncbi:MAG TPA: hypothetical protein VEJ36_04125 [Nitrososphaerales archaeon]|nr:hypothetical protein [Nitrososphaerales archaeon]
MSTDTDGLVVGLEEETGLTKREAMFYLSMLRGTRISASDKDDRVEKLLSKGMIILSGDDKEYIPVHPRLAVANQYRTWRESLVKEMNDRRMRVDKLIIRLIPMYEATTEKRVYSSKEKVRHW